MVIYHSLTHLFDQHYLSSTSLVHAPVRESIPITVDFTKHSQLDSRVSNSLTGREQPQADVQKVDAQKHVTRKSSASKKVIKSHKKKPKSASLPSVTQPITSEGGASAPISPAANTPLPLHLLEPGYSTGEGSNALHNKGEGTVFDPKMRQQLDNAEIYYTEKYAPKTIETYKNIYSEEIVVKGNRCFTLTENDDGSVTWSLPKPCPFIKTQSEKMVDALINAADELAK